MRHKQNPFQGLARCIIRPKITDNLPLILFAHAIPLYRNGQAIVCAGDDGKSDARCVLVIEILP